MTKSSDRRRKASKALEQMEVTKMPSDDFKPVAKKPPTFIVDIPVQAEQPTKDFDLTETFAPIEELVMRAENDPTGAFMVTRKNTDEEAGAPASAFDDDFISKAYDPDPESAPSIDFNDLEADDDKGYEKWKNLECVKFEMPDQTLRLNPGDVKITVLDTDAITTVDILELWQKKIAAKTDAANAAIVPIEHEQRYKMYRALLTIQMTTISELINAIGKTIEVEKEIGLPE